MQFTLLLLVNNNKVSEPYEKTLIQNFICAIFIKPNVSMGFLFYSKSWSIETHEKIAWTHSWFKYHKNKIPTLLWTQMQEDYNL